MWLRARIGCAAPIRGLRRRLTPAARCRCGAPGSGAEVPHAEGTARFGVRVVLPPECRLTVVAVDAERQTPVRDAKVVVHPYRAVTDERGVAEVGVPKGAYRLFVSGPNHVPFRWDGEMTTDVTIRAELALDLGISDADIWS
mgnify:CR=1 FL=1